MHIADQSLTISSFSSQNDNGSRILLIRWDLFVLSWKDDIAEQLSRADAEKKDPDKMRCPECRSWDTDPVPKGSRLGLWVQCERKECRQWWHAEHAEVDEERFQNICKKSEDFVCPFCTFPWLRPSYWPYATAASHAAAASCSASTQSDSQMGAEWDWLSRCVQNNKRRSELQCWSSLYSLIFLLFPSSLNFCLALCAWMKQFLGSSHQFHHLFRCSPFFFSRLHILLSLSCFILQSHDSLWPMVCKFSRFLRFSSWFWFFDPDSCIFSFLLSYFVVVRVHHRPVL